MSDTHTTSVLPRSGPPQVPDPGALRGLGGSTELRNSVGGAPTPLTDGEYAALKSGV